MASFWAFSLTLITLALVLCSEHSSSSHISLAPALAPNTDPTALPPAGHFQELSPETTPLFPTPTSGAALPPTESSMPTIPASLSPPNPDALNDPAFSPSGGGGAEGLFLPSPSQAPAHTDHMLVKLIPAILIALLAYIST